MLKARDLRDQSIQELEATHQDLRRQLFDLINQFKMSKKMEKPHLLIQHRRNIARVLTVISEKQRKTSE